MSLLTKFLLGDLFKAAHGRYADTAKNRRLHRVGQEYGHAAKEEISGPGRKPAQQNDEQKNPLSAKLDSLSTTQLSKLVDVSEKKLKEFKDKGYEQGAKKLEEIAREAKKRLMGEDAYNKDESRKKKFNEFVKKRKEYVKLAFDQMYFRLQTDYNKGNLQEGDFLEQKKILEEQKKKMLDESEGYVQKLVDDGKLSLDDPKKEKKEPVEEKKDLVQSVRDSVSDEKDAEKVEQDWEDKIRDYISEHYPTQANVTAETNSPRGREERERMKNDPELKRMLEQQDREFEEADKKPKEKQEPTEKKKSPLVEARERNKQADRDAYIADFEYADDKDLKDELKVLKRRLQNFPKNSRYPEGSKRYQAAIDEFNFQINALTEELQKRGVKVKPDEKKPAQEPKADKKPEGTGDDVKVEARMTFDDIPNSGKVKMAKYLSGARKTKVDKDFESIKNLDRDTVQTLHDALVKKFNDEFDDMHKADRAEALYKIAKVKNAMERK